MIKFWGILVLFLVSATSFADDQQNTKYKDATERNGDWAVEAGMNKMKLGDVQGGGKPNTAPPTPITKPTASTLEVPTEPTKGTTPDLPVVEQVARKKTKTAFIERIESKNKTLLQTINTYLSILYDKSCPNNSKEGDTLLTMFSACCSKERDKILTRKDLDTALTIAAISFVSNELTPISETKIDGVPFKNYSSKALDSLLKTNSTVDGYVDPILKNLKIESCEQLCGNDPNFQKLTKKICTETPSQGNPQTGRATQRAR